MTTIIFTALVPVFTVISAGYLCRRAAFPTADFWPGAERITYFFLFPALLFQTTATARIDPATALPLIKTLVTGVVMIALAMVLGRRIFGVAPHSFSSVFQGAIRFNTYVGFAVVVALFGADSLPLASLTIAVLIPLVNLLSVTACIHGSASHTGILSLMAIIIKTPPFLACTLGFGVSMLRFPLPLVLLDTLQICGRASLPLGLLAVGAGLAPHSLIRSLRPVLSVTVVKLLCMPMVIALTAMFFQLPQNATSVAVLFAALPGSASSYILARQLGGDSELMAAIVSVQIILSPLTLPLFLSFMLHT